ncbi:MAG: [FeFe] hydrogenase H-cluster radical SAM maturase HydE [Ruminococcaceae bacterium]|nr:[FeFe] hydrogenase H-cluster radical SAM maturase HydE [Oscillospiraceae bacterium]
MTDRIRSLFNTLIKTRTLKVSEYKELIEGYSPDAREYAAALALLEKEKVYGKAVFIRGLIEISNICKNDCRYCGIRKSNHNCSRYRLTPEEILLCCERGHELGFRTFVLQGGEDGYFTDGVLCPLIEEIKRRYPDCAVTLSLGERSRESYEKLYGAGADRYLLRHETADPNHYALLHPSSLSYSERMRCLRDLKDIGYQVGCGFMVGSPGQTVDHLAKDLKFIEEFSPHMCGIGPFIPHKDTEYKDCSAGSVDLTCYLLSIIRLIKPAILLPATTALGTLEENGREKGILSGANVVMPNLSPEDAKAKYTLYNNKLTKGAESAEALELLKEKMAAIGAEIVCARGDAK